MSGSVDHAASQHVYSRLLGVCSAAKVSRNSRGVRKGGPEEGEDAGLIDLVAVHVRQRGAILCGVGGDTRHEEAEEERQGNGAVLHEGRTHRLDEDLADADAKLPNNS